MRTVLGAIAMLAGMAAAAMLPPPFHSMSMVGVFVATWYSVTR